MLDTFNNKYHAEILPVPEGVMRPLWSVLIPTYNCAEFLKETLASVLMQDPGPEKMEIIVIDDHSTLDDPEKVVKEFGKGRVLFFRQSQNVGKVRNYETGLKLSKGRLIHQLHGDDLVRPGFYTKMEGLFLRFPKSGAAFCRSIYINEKGLWTGITGIEKGEDGIIDDFLPKIYTEQRIQTPSVVVNREVYESLGGFDNRLSFVEDWEMWIRIACFYPYAFTPEVLAEYRSHSTNTSSISLRNGILFKETRELFCIVDKYIGGKLKSKYSLSRNRKQAFYIVTLYRQIKTNLNTRQKLFFLKRIMELDFRFISIIRFFRN